MALADSNLACEDDRTKESNSVARFSRKRIQSHITNIGNWNCLGAEVLRAQYFKQNIGVQRVRSTG